MASVPPAIWNSTSSRSFSWSTAPFLNGVTIATMLPLNIFLPSFRGKCAWLEERRNPLPLDQLLDRLPFADHLERAPLHHHLGHARPAIVAARHGKAIGTGGHECHQVPLLEHGDFAVLD